MTALKNYEVTEARFIGGQHRKVGDPVQMTERAAKYYVAPYGTGLKAVSPVAATVADKPVEKQPAKTKPAVDAKD
ncbi:hypothetical protein [Pseudooceanicola sp. MF1-13]|uniref:hypothetical protein n=1 Tax=Pseudooceanicola sp. MF1-13 TaxID=3379095 RepID=UPI003892190A